jgi:hypothetical protein
VNDSAITPHLSSKERTRQPVEPGDANKAGPAATKPPARQAQRRKEKKARALTAPTAFAAPQAHKTFSHYSSSSFVGTPTAADSSDNPSDLTVASNAAWSSQARTIHAFKFAPAAIAAADQRAQVAVDVRTVLAAEVISRPPARTRRPRDRTRQIFP